MTLPRGWATTALGEIADTKLGKMLDKARNQGTPTIYLRNINVRWGAFDLSDLEEMKVTDQEAQELAVRDGDIFVCEGGEPGRAAVWKAGATHLVFQKALHRVRMAGGSDPDFLALRLRFAASRGEYDQLLTGSTIKHLPQVALQRVTLELPPAAEQRRIVTKLDALTANIARARSELRQSASLATRLRDNALRTAIDLPDECLLPLRDALLDVRYGTAEKCDYNLGATPVLRIPNVRSGKIDAADLKSADFSRSEVEKLALQLGDVLVIRSNGSLDIVGRSAVVDAQCVGMLYAGYLIRLRLDQTRLLPRYFQYYLEAPQTRARLEKAARSSSGVNNINAQQLQDLVVPLPSLAEQGAVVAKLDSAFARADRLEAEATRALALLDRLEAAILAKAFRGELVPQDPNDEPASVMLERIRAARAASPKTTRKRRTTTG